MRSEKESRLALFKRMNLARVIQTYADLEQGFWSDERLDIQIVKLPGEPPEFYLIDHKDFVGKGGYGQIFKAYPIDVETGQVQVESPFIVKKIEEDRTSLSKIEVEQLATSKTRTTRNIRFEDYPVKSETETVNKACYLFFTEYLPGSIAFDADKLLLALAQAIEKVSLESRLTAIIGLLNDIRLVQSQVSGPAFLHGDVNQRNILIRVTHLSRGGSKVTASLIDNGEAQRLPPSTENETVIILNPFECQPSMHGHERFFGRMGPKSDIYSSALFVAFFLGCQTPLKNIDKAFNKGFGVIKSYFPQARGNNTNHVWEHLIDSGFGASRSSYQSARREYFRELFSAGYDIDDILFGYGLSPVLVKVVKAFVNRMQAIYRDRPDVHEALQFFTLLDCALKVGAVSDQNDALARLILIVSGRPAQETDVLSSVYCGALIDKYGKGASLPLLSEFPGALLVSTQPTIVATQVAHSQQEPSGQTGFDSTF